MAVALCRTQRMKMTKSEVKDEQKQTDGDPVIKGQQRRKMMEMMSKRMLADVPKADVVVTNPTHIAVALSYNITSEARPDQACQGRRPSGRKIKEVAREKPDSHSRNVCLWHGLCISPQRWAT